MLREGFAFRDPDPLRTGVVCHFAKEGKMIKQIAAAIAAESEGAWSLGLQNCPGPISGDEAERVARSAIEESGVLDALSKFVADREYAAAMNGPASVNYVDTGRFKEDLRKILLGE